VEDLHQVLSSGPSDRLEDETLEQYRERVDGFYRTTNCLIRYAEDHGY
jgi:hypothetical protein